jgi:hypothetical protein
MVWVEMIRLRTTGFHEKMVKEMLNDAVHQAEGQPGLLHLRVYNSVSLATDMALTLVWDTDSYSGKGSKAGLVMADTFKTFGLVDHSVWIERAPHN